MTSRLPRTLRAQSGLSGLAVAGSALFIGAAQADVTISSAATENMTCSGGVCAPTATDAVLNVGDLENLLASGGVTVTTTGSGVQADNIDVNGALSWSSTATLTLDAYDSVAVGSAVSVTGQGGLSLVTNDGGSGGALSFGSKGHASFANLSSPLTINGVSYALEATVKSLAAAVKANPSGDYALAADYDASQDHTYSNAPVSTALTGTVEGLGNVISHLAITDTRHNDDVGLFAHVAGGGAVNDLGLDHAAINGLGRSEIVGGLTGQDDGALTGDWVAGAVAGGKTSVTGGLAGNSSAAITRCHVTATVHGKKGATVGGLAATQGQSTISESYVTGRVTVDATLVQGHKGLASLSAVGGLVALAAGVLDDSYATGDVKGGDGSTVGGLAANAGGGAISDCYATNSVTGGANLGKYTAAVGGLVGIDSYESGFGGPISDSYSTGVVRGGEGSLVGGFAGYVFKDNTAVDDYWDTKTSGTDVGVGEGSTDGITGLTTKQLRSGLPQGFDPSIWAEKRSINGGLPYLLGNPPPK